MIPDRKLTILTCDCARISCLSVCPKMGACVCACVPRKTNVDVECTEVWKPVPKVEKSVPKTQTHPEPDIPSSVRSSKPSSTPRPALPGAVIRSGGRGASVAGVSHIFTTSQLRMITSVERTADMETARVVAPPPPHHHSVLLSSADLTLVRPSLS